MAGYGPKIPFGFDKLNGVILTETIQEEIKQNFKNLILTNPGERVMDLNFGVGLMSYLFELDVPATQSNIRAKIDEQINIYMSYINVKKIDFFKSENSLQVVIYYYINSLNDGDILDLNFPI